MENNDMYNSNNSGNMGGGGDGNSGYGSFGHMGHLLYSGGIEGSDINRHLSLGPTSETLDASALSDMMGRPPSMGYSDGGGGEGMSEMMTPHRDSMDTAAMLDACILDLTRRRAGMMPSQSTTTGMPTDLGYGSGIPTDPGMSTGIPTDLSICAPRGMTSLLELQKEQFEIERRQRELELQRQQLLAGIGGGSSLQDYSLPLAGIPSQINNSYGYVADMPSNEMMIPPPPPQQPNPQQQWWVCHICNSKAFASQDEAMQHEAVCSSRNHLQRQQPPFEYMDPGTYSQMPNPLPLAMPTDKDWLTPLHCFVRQHCVEVFSATDDDVATPSKGKRRPIQVGQVGIRCPHCSTTDESGQRERGSVYYPTTISSIYNATMNLLQRHLHTCPCCPDGIMAKYQTLKGDDARSGTSKKYWVESALSMGLVDTPSGIRYSSLSHPPLRSIGFHQHSNPKHQADEHFFSTKSNASLVDAKQEGEEGDDEAEEVCEEETNAEKDKAMKSSKPNDEDESKIVPKGPLVVPADRTYATGFSYELLCHMQPCVFTEADRLGKRKGLPPGFAGLACKHCFGGYGSGRFFPSTIKTLSDTSKTLNVLHNHMMRCRKCPQQVRDDLEKLREQHDDERAKMKFGSQKAFFARIWARLHGSSPSKTPMKRASMPEPPVRYMEQVSSLMNQNLPMHGYMHHMGMVPGVGLDILSQHASCRVLPMAKRHRSLDH